MTVRACFLLFGIFANPQSFAYQPEIDPKRVNLAIKTVLEFHPKDKQSDIKLLDDIQNVITEIRTIIDENGNIKNFRRNSRDETLTGFIQDAINIINTFEDIAFDNLVHILDAEIKKYHYRGCKFSELTANHEIEKLITAKLDSIKSRSTYFKKMKINALSGVLKYEDYDGDVKKIMDYINSLYTQAGDKFQRFLSNLEGYGKSKSSRSSSNLVKIIRNGLRSIIFDHYTNLNVNTRRHLRHQIEHFWRRYKMNHLSKGGNVAKVTPYYTKNSKNIINEAKDLEPGARKYQKSTYNKINQKLIKTKQSQHKNKITNKYHLKNEKTKHNNTRRETFNESLEIKEKKTRQSSQNTDLVVQQRDDIKLQRQTGDVDILSASLNSIELHKDHQDNTQQFITIVPDKYTEKSTKVIKKPEKINTMNVTTKTPTNITIQKKLLWIEQSTGRLPKAVLDKLANKVSRSNSDLTGKNLNKYDHKHKKNKNQKRWHRKVNKPDKMRRKGYEPENAKTHDKMYDHQNHKTLRYSELIRDKTNEKTYQQENEKTYGKIYKQADGNIYEPDNDSLFNNINEEVQQYNKTKGMLRLELKHDNRPIRSTSEPGKTKKHLVRGTATTKKSPAFSRRPRSQFDDTARMKPTHQTSRQTNSSIRWLHVELPLKAYSKSNNKWSKKHDIYSRKSIEYSTSLKESITARNIEIIDDKRHSAQTTPFSYLKDSFERQSNRGISRANDNIEEGRKVKHRFEVKRYVEKPTQIETMSTLDDKLKQDTSKMAGTADHETGSINYVTDKDSKIIDNDIERCKTLDTRFRSDVIMIPEDFKLKNKFNTAETAVNKTDFSIEDDNRHNAQTKDKQKMKQQTQRTKEERKVKHSFEVNKYVEKPKQIETMSTLDDTLKQDTSKMADTADHETDLINYVTDKDSKIKDNDVKIGITLETKFRSDFNMIPDDFNLKDKLNTAENALKKTEFFIEDHKDKYAEKKILYGIVNGKKSETGFELGVEMPPIDNVVRFNVTAAAQNETDFIIEHVVDEDSKNNENRIEKAKKFKTRTKSNPNNIFKVTQNKLNMAGTAVNKIELKKENNNIQDKYSKNNDTPVMRFRSDNTEMTETADNITLYKDSIINIENGKKSETNFTSDINMMPNDFNDKPEKTNTRTADIKVDFIEKENDFKSKDVVDKDHPIYKVDNQTSIIREAPKEKDQIEKDTKQQYIDEVTYFEAKYREMNDQDGETLTKDNEIKVPTEDQKDDNIFGTQTPTTSIASTSSSMKGTESTTKASATTVVQTAPATPKLTAPVSIPVVTSSN